MRPAGINDLQVSWAIRDIPSSILEFKYKGLLWGLLSIIGNNESCYYSQSQLVKILGIGERTLQDHLYHLRDKKFISITAPDRKGRGYANEYLLNYSLIMEFSNKDAKAAGLPVKLSTKHADSASLSYNKHADSACITEISTQKTTKKHADSASQDIQQDIHKSRESKTASASPPPLSLFEPDEQNKTLCQDLRLNLPDEIESFRRRHKGAGDLQYEFSRWMKASKEYQARNRPKDEVRSTVQFWGPGHPGWESLHGKRKSDAKTH